MWPEDLLLPACLFFYTAFGCTLVTSSEGVFYDLTAQERENYEQYMESDDYNYTPMEYRQRRNMQ